MERFETARLQMFEERRKVQERVENERRKTVEILEEYPIIISNRRVYLYGQVGGPGNHRVGKAHLKDEIVRQLKGER